jgi:hypothetical protein
MTFIAGPFVVVDKRWAHRSREGSVRGNSQCDEDFAASMFYGMSVTHNFLDATCQTLQLVWHFSMELILRGDGCMTKEPGKIRARK